MSEIYDIAILGAGPAGIFTAMEMLKKGNDKFYYSLALKENRKDFLRNNLLWILPVVIIVITVIIIGIKKIRLWLLSYRTNRRGR